MKISIRVLVVSLLCCSAVPAAQPVVFQLNGQASEFSGTSVLPQIAPTGYPGTVMHAGTGLMSLVTVPGGTGMSFSTGGQQKTNTSFLSFPGASTGYVFGNSGQITFNLTSKYSFSQRQALPAGNSRFAFDVWDATQSQFSFSSSTASGRLLLSFKTGGKPQVYYLPAGKEDAMFGQGVTLAVSINWNGTRTQLSLNNSLVVDTAYTPYAANWAANSLFTLGSQANYGGGYFSSDDAISNFTVMSGAAPTLSTSITAPAANATVSGTVNVTASATASLGVASVQLSVDGAPLGAPDTVAPYAATWDTTTVSDGSHTLTSLVTDTGNNTSQASTMVNVKNAVSGDTVPPSTPTGLFTGHTTTSQITLLWSPATDNVGVTGYHLFRDGAQIASQSGLSFTDSNLAAGVAHSYQIAAYDAAGNVSALSAPLQSSTISTTAAVYTVGPGRAYTLPCAALTVAPNGSLIEIDPAGNYAGDTCVIYGSNLTIRGLNGRAKIPAGSTLAQSKAIWVVNGNAATIENIEFSGAVSASGGNGAGIRQEGVGVTIRNCYFHNNQDGILAGDNLPSNILIEFSEFAFNGAGDGKTHNLYINHVNSFTFRYNYSHDAIVGHLYKSRAATNYVLYNRLSDNSGTASYEVDLPNGGQSYVIGNLIEQSPNSNNPNVLAYGEEGASASNPNHDLFVVNNTFDNEKSTGYAVLVNSAMNPAHLQNNIFYGAGLVLVGAGTQVTDLSGVNPLFTNSGAYDYTLLPGSPALGAGTLPGIGDGYALTPTYEYSHPAGGKVTTPAGRINIGAYSY